MAITVNAKSIEEVPEIMREFVTESDGAFVYDEEKAFKALVEERNGRRADRKELSQFKAIGKTPDELLRFTAIGKTPDEISELLKLAESKNNFDPEKLTEAEKARLLAEKNYKNLEGEFNKLKAKIEESERKAADAELRALCEGLIDQLPQDLDKDKARLWLLGGKTPEGIEVKGTYRNFTRNAIGDIEDIGGLSPLDYLVAMSNALGYKKASTPGNAKPGNATISKNGGNADYETAKKSGDVMGLIRNAPDAKLNFSK